MLNRQQSMMNNDVIFNPLFQEASVRGLYSIFRRTLNPTFCWRVRRSSDDAEKDIGWLGSGINMLDLLDFIGVNDGFIVTWYDESIAANNASQSDKAKQPKIASLGTLIVDADGHPNPEIPVGGSLILDDSNEFWTYAGLTMFTTKSPVGASGPDTSNAQTFHAKTVSNTPSIVLGGTSSALTGESYGFIANNTGTGNGQGREGSSLLSFSAGERFLETVRLGTSEALLRKNGVSVTLNLIALEDHEMSNFSPLHLASGVAPVTDSTVSIRTNAVGTNIQEVIIYDTTIQSANMPDYENAILDSF